jgi:hypothetical protein
MNMIQIAELSRYGRKNGSKSVEGKDICAVELQLVFAVAFGVDDDADQHL